MRFPDAPKLSPSAMRMFYRKNNIPHEYLYKDEYNYAKRFLFSYEEDPEYLNGKLDNIPEPLPEDIEILRKWWVEHPWKLLSLSDELCLYVIHKDVLKMQEKWS